MNINKHNVAIRWITRRRTNEVAGLYESFPGTFSAYQEALSSGFQGTMEEFIQHQSIPQSDRPFTGKVGGLVEPGVTHYGKAHMDDPLYNIKAGDDLGKGVIQNLQWNRPKTKKTISGYSAQRGRLGKELTRRDFTAVKKFWETLEKPVKDIKPIKNTWDTVKDLHKFEDYLNEDKTWSTRRTKFKKPAVINETWWNSLTGVRRSNIIAKYKTNYLPRLGTTGSPEIGKLLGFKQWQTFASMISISKKDPNLFAVGSKEYVAITRANKLLKQLENIGIVPKYVGGPKSTGVAPETIFSAPSEEQMKGLKKIKDERALIQKKYETRRTKRQTISVASKKTLTPEAKKLNTMRVELLANMNAKVRQMSDPQLKAFIKRNSRLLEMVEATIGLKGKIGKQSIDDMSPVEIRNKIHFEGDHIKTFKEAKWDAVTKKVLTGLDIEAPGNLRLSPQIMNNSFKKRALVLFQTTVDTKDPEIIKNKKAIEGFFKRTGQALSLETGQIIGAVGDIDLQTQLRHLVQGEDFKELIEKIQTGKTLTAAEKLNFTKLAQTLGPDGWRFLGIDYDDPGRIAKLFSKASESIARSPTAVRAPLQLTGKLATGVGRFLADPFFFPLIPVEMMVASAYGFEKNKDNIMKSLKENPLVTEMARKYKMNAKDVRNAILEKYRRAVLNTEGGLEEQMAFEPKHDEVVETFDKKFYPFWDPDYQPVGPKKTDTSFVKDPAFSIGTGSAILGTWQESEEEERKLRSGEVGGTQFYKKPTYYTKKEFYPKDHEDPALAEQLKSAERIRFENLRPFEDPLPVGFYGGGRVPFVKGKLVDEGRRKFMQWLAGITGAGIAAGTGLLKWGAKKGAGKTVIKAGDHIIQGTKGMPDWFIPLVNRITSEGKDVTKKLGTIEREIVHSKQISKGEHVDVYQDMNTGNVRVEYQSKHSEVPIQMEYKAGEVIESGKYKGQKTKPEFEAVESEPNWTRTGPDDADLVFEGENVVGRVEDLTTDTSKLKQFATKKKPTMKEIVESKKKQDYRKSLEHDTQTQADYIEGKYGPGPEPDTSIDEFGNVIDEYGEIID